MSSAITYLPKNKVILAGSHENGMPAGAEILATASTISERKWESNTLNASSTPKTMIKDTKLKRLAALIAANKDKIISGQLTAADFNINRDTIDPLILIRLHQQLMGEQMKYFHLDEMFNEMPINQLLYRMSFSDNPANAQEVGPRQTYDTAKRTYQDIMFALTKKVVSYDIAIEDPLMSLIDPVLPLQQTNEWSMQYFREQEALAAMQKLKYHYHRNMNGEARFSSTSKPGTAQGKLPNPAHGNNANVHSENKVANDIQNMRNAFLQEYDLPLTHFAVSPRTAMDLAQNTWTNNNTIFNVEAYRTNGGVRTFPGLADATMVISIVVPDHEMYCVSKPQNVLVKAEGPKITKTWEDNTRHVMQTATLDFHQYKCAHEDLTMTRKFGIIAEFAAN